MTTKTPIELSSTPSVVDNGNATAITIDSSENVTVNNGTLTSSGANGADNQGFHITDTGYSKTHKLFGDNSLHIQADSGQSILMKPNASEKARFTSDGLTFNGDTAAANALDDYEEGTWTPQITASSGSAGTAAYSNQVGRYTKIGNKVFFEFSVVMTNKGSWSAYTRVLGFPFTANSTGLSPFAVSRFPDDTIGANMIAGELQPSSTYCFFTTGSRLDSLHDISNVDTGYYLIGSGHYSI
jgi:hypothetical protein